LHACRSTLEDPHFGVYYTPNLELKSIPPANGLVPVGVTADPMLYLPKYDF
jgi:hypothetical protein